MADPTDRSRFLLTLAAALWAMAFGYAFVAGATGGLRVYLGWQGFAGIVAVAVHALSRSWPKGGPVRRSAAVPLRIAILHALGVAGYWLWTQGVFAER